MKSLSPNHVGILYTCKHSSNPVLAKNGSVHHYEHVFICEDELAEISNFAKVSTKFKVLCMEVDFGKPLIAEGDTVSITFERRVKHYNCQPAKIWWTPTEYTSYTKRVKP